MGSMQQKHNDRAIIHLDVADFAVAVRWPPKTGQMDMRVFCS